MHRLFLLCIGLIFATSAVIAAPLTDIAGQTNQTAIEFLREKGIINGYADGTFRPDATINRAELLKVLIKMTGVEPSKDLYARCFPDVKNEWFAPFVCYAKKQMWISGYKDGTFKPANAVSTAEAIKIIVTAGHCTQMQSAATSRFSDVIPGTWYAPYVQAADNAGLLQWVEGTKLNMAKGLTRGHMSEMLFTCMTGNMSSSKGSSSSTSSGLWTKLVTTMHRSGGGGQRTAATTGTTQTTGTIPSSSTNSTISSSSIASSSSSSAGLITPTINLSGIAKNYGDANFTLSPTSDSAGSFSYISGNTGVATISGNTVTIHAVGSTVITVNQAANGLYGAGSTTATLTVSAIAPTIGTFSNVTKQMGDIPFTLTAPTSNSAGAFTFSSGNAGVATIAGNTVTLVSNGTAIITATQAANGNYTIGTKTMTLTVAAGECSTEPCLNEGVCTNGPGGTYSCSCVGMYSGDICELNDAGCNYDHGAMQGCVNAGFCEPTAFGGYCICPANFCGQYCENPDMDSDPSDGYCI